MTFLARYYIKFQNLHIYQKMNLVLQRAYREARPSSSRISSKHSKIVDLTMKIIAGLSKNYFIGRATCFAP